MEEIKWEVTCTNLHDKVSQTWIDVVWLTDKLMWKTQGQFVIQLSTCSLSKEVEVSSDWNTQGQHQG